MASRPTTIPQLDTSKTNRVAPVAGKIASGYVLNDLFPSSNANYLHGWAGDWLEWLQERSEDGTTPGTDLTLRGLDALTTTSDGGTVTLTAGDGGSVSGDGGEIELYPGNQTSGNHGGVSIGAPRVTTWAQLEINGNAYQAGTDLVLVANSDNNSYAEIGLGSWDSGTEYGSWYWTAFGYQHATLAGKLRLNHAKNVAGGVVATPIMTVTNDDKIGFGTTDPDTFLHLYGAAPDITFEDTVGDKYLMGNSDGSFRIYNVTDSRFGMYIDGNGLVGVGNFSGPQGTMHIFTADAGVITPNTGADDLVVENSTYVGMTFMAPATSGGSTIAFAYPGSALAGQVYFDNDDDKLYMQVGSSPNYLVIDSSGNVGVNEDTPLSKTHVKVGDAGAIAPSVGGITIESDSAAGLNIFSAGGTNWGLIYFGDAANDTRGIIWADHNNNDFYVTMDNAASGGGMQIDGSNGRVCVGSDLNTPTGTLHISTNHVATAISADADDLVVTSTGNTGMTILAGTTSNAAIHFGDTGDVDIGKIDYDNNNNSMIFHVSATDAMQVGGASTDHVGIPSATTNARFSVVEDNGGGSALYAEANTGGGPCVSILHDGNAANRIGVRIGCGLDTPSVNNDVEWIQLLDGNGTYVCSIAYSTTPPNATFAAVSDARLKTNIVDTQVSGLDILKRLPLRAFDWKDGKRPSQDIAFVAQEVAAVYPHMASYNEELDLHCVLSGVLEPLLVKAIQELSAEVETLKQRLN
jgi:hypothetical protein